MLKLKWIKTVVLLSVVLSLLVLSSCVQNDSSGLGDMFTNNIYPGTANTYSLGSASLPWASAWITSINGAPYTPGGVPALTSGHLFVGNVLNVATDVAAGGDVSLANTGAFTVSGLQGVALPALATGYLQYNLGTGLWTFGAGGSGITSIGVTTPTSLTGILTGNGTTVGSITDSSSNWNTAYTDRITSVSGSGALTLTLGVNSISGSVDLSSKQNSSSILSGLASLTYVSGSPFVTMTGASTFGLDSTTYQAHSSALDAVSAGTWAGDSSISTLGTVTTGTLSGVTIQGTISSGTGLTFGNFAAGTITGALSGNATTATSAGSVTGLSVTAGKTLTVSNSMTLAATDGATLTIGAGGTLGTAAYTASSAYSPVAGSSSIVTVGVLTGGSTGSGFTLALGTSTISGTLAPANGGTGVANGVNNTITFSGNYTLGLTLSNNTSVTLPTSGTLATLAGAETLTNKTITTPTVNIVLTAGETISAGAGCYVKSDGKVYNAKADSSTTMPCTLLCTVGATVGNPCTLVCFGYVTTGSWTAGGYIYVSDSVAGGLTQTLPSTSGDQVQVVGIAITSTQVYWYPSLTIVGRS